MIYDSLKMPMVLFSEILETGNLRLLAPDEQITDLELTEIWTKLHADYEERANRNKPLSRDFTAYREIQYLEMKLYIIKCTCESLRFDANEDLLAMLKGYGYLVRRESYLKDLDRVVREAEGIKVRIARVQQTIRKDDSNSTKTDIIQVMANIAIITGFDFDFYTVSVEKFLSLDRAAEMKAKAMEEASNPRTENPKSKRQTL